MIEKKLNRVPSDEMDAPNRCQGVVKSGQCPFFAEENSKFCEMHANNKQKQKANNEAIRNFRLGQWQNRVNEFADNPKVKSLREEVGILRMVLESYLNRCQTDNDIILFSNKISDLVVKSEKLVASCHKLEEASGLLMDREAAITFADRLIEVVSKHVTDLSALDEIGKEILLAIGSLNKLSAPIIE